MVAHGIVQAGDPESKNPQARAKYGTSGFNLGLKPEISDLPFTQGTVVATVLPGEPNSAGSQFFICVTDQLQFTRQYTAFAHVVEGNCEHRLRRAPAFRPLGVARLVARFLPGNFTAATFFVQ